MSRVSYRGMLAILVVLLLSGITLSSGTSPDDDVELVVRYKKDMAPASVDRATFNAAASYTEEDEDDIRIFNTAIINTKRKNIENLQGDERIQMIGESSAISSMSLDDDDYMADQPSPPATRRTNRIRTLLEEDPYGIALTQADQVAQGPTNVKVCIVDSGYALGHEDLPDTSNHGVRGYSPYGGSQKWNKDEIGHGTHHAGKFLYLPLIIKEVQRLTKQIPNLF